MLNSYHSESAMGGNLQASFTLDVGLNLSAALRRLHSKYPGVALWIDFICINQADLDEKNRQVAIMADIYRNAGLVVVWLGEETEFDPLAFEIVRDFATTDAESFRKSDGTVPQFVVRHGLDSSSENSYSQAWWALRGLLSRDWFSRIWCVQEFSLASIAFDAEPHMVCGSQVLDWRYFGILSMTLQHPQFSRGIRADLSFVTTMQWLRDARASILHTHRKGAASENPSTDRDTLHLTTLLSLFAEQKASLKVDKIFALLNLANDVRDNDGRLLFLPDYRKSILQLQLDLSAFFIQKDGNLNVLSYLAVYERESTAQMATWVPDWTNEQATVARSIVHVIGALGDDKFCTSGKNLSFYKVPTTTDGIYLQTHGFCVGMISSILPAIPDYKSTAYNECCDVVLSIWPTIYDTLAALRDGPRSSEEDLFHFFWRTLSVDRSEVTGHWIKHFKVSSVEHRQDTNPQLSSVPTDACDVDGDEHAPFANTVRFAHWGRRLFMTDSGYLGLGPATARPGDHVYIVQGAKTPFVLRETASEATGTTSRMLNVVGEAYVDGLMYGELATQLGKWHGILDHRHDGLKQVHLNIPYGIE